MSAKKTPAKKRGRPAKPQPDPPKVIAQTPKTGEVETSVLASLFNLTAARIGQLAKDGIIVKTGTNTYHLAKSIRGYIEYLQRARNGDANTRIGMESSKLKKIQAEAAILEHKLSIQKGEYVSSESQLAEGMKLGLVIRGIFQRVEPDLTPRIAGRTAAECSDILREYMHAKLVELSEYESSIAIAAD